MEANDDDMVGSKFDIREDEEQNEKLQDIIDLLIAAGYFRARLKGLSAFDKVIGGLVWCITLCNQTIDVDLFYSENSTIGQKIALTEKVVKVLSELKCQHSIEPHQIQGLDYIHIFPVVQWLMREVVKAKVKVGQSMRRYAYYQFDKRFRFIDDKPENLSRAMYLNNCKLIKSKCDPKYVHKAKEICQKVEFDQFSAEVATSENYNENKNGTGDAGIQQEEGSLSELDRLEKELEDLKEENKLLNIELNGFERLEQTRKEIREIDERLKNFERVISNFDEETLEIVKELLSQHDEIRQREAAFKASCREECERLDEELEKYEKMNRQKQAEINSGHTECNKEERVELENELTRLRREAAELSKHMTDQQRSLDETPANVELSQYQRRIIELYDQMASMNCELKQSYLIYNALIDIKTYVEREIDILNNIDDILDAALKESNKDSFIENLQNISKGINATVDKFTTKLKQCERDTNTMGEQYHHYTAKQHTYHDTLHRFKMVCLENERLRKRLGNSGLNV